MNETPETILRRLFTSDTNARDYYAKNPLYDGDDLVGARPWWPPLAEVWAEGEVCPDTFPNAAAWRDAWVFLQNLHAQYLQQTRGKTE
ncbi:MAG TPA: hypothetical protein VJT80_13500 [Steroidobacteraceae bacterium]|nr:hypothetical protein [Steroidobacteraceae bacterium]